MVDEVRDSDKAVGAEVGQTVTEGSNPSRNEEVAKSEGSEDVCSDSVVYDPYELSRNADKPSHDASAKSKRKFNTVLFLVISAVFCVLLCKSCDRLITHPSEFVLGSPPGAFVNEGELEIQNARMRHDVDLFYECLNNIILGREPDKQVERFINNKYGTLKDSDQKCVDLLKVFTEAQKEYVKIFLDFGVAWTNSGELAIYFDTWDREHDKRGWDDLVKEAEAAVNALTKGVSEHERKYLVKIEGIIGMRNKKWLKNVRETFMLGFACSKLISIRTDEVNILKSLVELCNQNADKVEERDGRIVFKDDTLPEKQMKAWQAIDKDEKEIAKLLDDAMKMVEAARAKVKQ